MVTAPSISAFRHFGVCGDAIARHWPQITELKPLQEQALAAVLADRDLLAVMPTGSGKSLCFQAPAAMDASPLAKAVSQGGATGGLTTSAGLTLVICPLISLMQDQVDSLNRRGIPAAFINSTQNWHEQQQAVEDAKSGRILLLYMAPERAVLPETIALLAKCRLRNVVIDEAHCISQWGQDFRPAYAAFAGLRTVFPNAPIQCFTATATPRVRDEIIATLGLRGPAVVLVGDFDRPNLHLAVRPRVHPDAQIVGFVREQLSAKRAGIVYCITRAETVQLSELLGVCGIAALWYHGQMEAEARRRVQDAFMSGRVDVVCATIAFGMGLDRPDVRWILHAAMPSSVEVYHQEIGRAGRDGRRADCLLLHAPSDVDKWQAIFDADQRELGPASPLTKGGSEGGPIPASPLTKGGPQGSPIDNQTELLWRMHDFCRLPGCRHRRLVEYFGQAWSAGDVPCGACDACEAAGIEPPRHQADV